MLAREIAAIPAAKQISTLRRSFYVGDLGARDGYAYRSQETFGIKRESSGQHRTPLTIVIDTASLFEKTQPLQPRQHTHQNSYRNSQRRC